MIFDNSETYFSNIGKEMYKWASDLFPLNRSITGQGNRETLDYLKKMGRYLRMEPYLEYYFFSL